MSITKDPRAKLSCSRADKLAFRRKQDEAHLEGWGKLKRNGEKLETEEQCGKGGIRCMFLSSGRKL